MTQEEIREKKYNAIALYNSNIITLQDLKALFRVGAVLSTDEYMSQSSQEVLLTSRDRINKIRNLAQTRKGLIKQLRRKEIKPFAMTRDEAIAQLITFWKAGKLPHNWKRYPIHERKGKPNKPRPGSSKGKIGKVKHRGFKKLNRDLDSLFDSIARLLEIGEARKGKIKKLLAQAKPTITVTKG